jgi:hypothetical protein
MPITSTSFKKGNTYSKGLCMPRKRIAETLRREYLTQYGSEMFDILLQAARDATEPVEKAKIADYFLRNVLPKTNAEGESIKVLRFSKMDTTTMEGLNKGMDNIMKATYEEDISSDTAQQMLHLIKAKGDFITTEILEKKLSALIESTEPPAKQ